jgi:hypothetical protein
VHLRTSLRCQVQVVSANHGIRVLPRPPPFAAAASSATLRPPVNGR